MTEAEWLACEDPAPMLAFLQDRISDRKRRLFAVGCCRCILHLMPDERSRRAVQVAELFADGLVTEAEAEATGNAAADVSGDDFPGLPEALGWRAARAADHLLPVPEESWQLNLVWQYAATALEGEQLFQDGANPAMLDTWSEQSVESGRTRGWTSLNPDALLADILRDLVERTPFRSMAVSPAVLEWSNGTMVQLAQGIYDDRAFDRLPTLADALEDAGCDNEDILQHCRVPGPHVRGCGVLDLLLGKK